MTGSCKVNSKEMRDKILHLVKNNPELANDDKRLIASVWWTEGWHDLELYDHLKMVSSQATITRTRRKLVEEGLIKPSKEATEMRREQEQQVREEVRRYL